jgi:putative holliday junction resolvase
VGFVTIQEDDGQRYTMRCLFSLKKTALLASGVGFSLIIGHQNMARLMALDVGEARIGVAVSDTTGFLASPYTTIHVSRNEQQNWDTIQRLLEETEAEGIIIGLPISLDGQIHTQGQKVQSFAERLRPHISVPLTFWDERFSTVEAERFRAGGGKRQRQAGRGRAQSKRRQRGHEIDALAAAVILQEYLLHYPHGFAPGGTTEEKGV